MAGQSFTTGFAASSSSWPSPWQTRYAVSGAAARTVVGAGILEVGAVDDGEHVGVAASPVLSDCDVTAVVERVSGGPDAEWSVVVRDQGNAGPFASAYRLFVGQGWAGLLRFDDGVGTALSGSVVATGFAASGASLTVRIRAEGASIRARMWATAGVEPSSWDWDVEDDTYGAGRVGVAVSGPTGTGAEFRVASVAVSDLAPSTEPPDPSDDPSLPTLGEGQFWLDGYVFGGRGDEVILLESGLDTDAADVREQDEPHPGADRWMFGRDRRTPPTWTFSLGARDDADVYAVLERFAAAWGGYAVRDQPGAVSTLVYRRNGETRVVYGRPRQFVVETPAVLQHDFRVITAQFKLADVNTYSGALSEVVLGTIQTTTSTGVIFPVVFPVVFGSPPGERAGWVTVTSPVPTPFVVEITGPSTGVASGFRVSSAGWVLDVPVTLHPGQVLTVDTATSTVAVNGAAVSTGVGRRTDLTARIRPGTQEVKFSADDPSGTARATIRWREASTTW